MRSDFFKQLNRELEELTPEMSETLKNAPIVAERSTVSSDGVAAARRERNGGFWARNGKRLASVAAALVVLCCVGLGLLFSIRPAADDFVVMQVDVNPSAEFVLDREYKVVKVVSGNSDGDALLGDEVFLTSLTGTSSAEAARLFAERAARMGYMDPSDTGSAENYNKVLVTFRSQGEVPQSIAEETAGAVTDYFCRQGVYVYTETNILPHADVKKEEYEARRTFVYDGLSEETDLETYAANALYAYAEDLLKDALYKYDLFEKIYELNDRIENAAANLFKLSYWSVEEKQDAKIAALCEEMAKYLETMAVLYGPGLDFRERRASVYISFLSSYSTYTATYSEDLRELYAAGINENTFLGDQNLGIRTKFFAFVSADMLLDIIHDFFENPSETLEELAQGISALIENRTALLYERYSALFDCSRAQIGAQEYGEFLKRIGKG